MEIENILKAKGLTKSALADLLEIKKQSINGLLKNPTLVTMERIAKALNVEVWELFVNPNELNKSVSNSACCPHCGKAIKLS